MCVCVPSISDALNLTYNHDIGCSYVQDPLSNNCVYRVELEMVKASHDGHCPTAGHTAQISFSQDGVCLMGESFPHHVVVCCTHTYRARTSNGIRYLINCFMICLLFSEQSLKQRPVTK